MPVFVWWMLPWETSQGNLVGDKIGVFLECSRLPAGGSFSGAACWECSSILAEDTAELLSSQPGCFLPLLNKIKHQSFKKIEFWLSVQALIMQLLKKLHWGCVLWNIFFLNRRWIVLFSICVLQSFWRSFFAVWYSGHPGKVLQGRFCLLCVCSFICSGRAKVLLFSSAFQVSKHIPHLSISAAHPPLIPRGIWSLGVVFSQQVITGVCAPVFRGVQLFPPLVPFTFSGFFLCEHILEGGNAAGVCIAGQTSHLGLVSENGIWFFVHSDALTEGLCFKQNQEILRALYLLLIWSFHLQIQPLHNHGYRTAGLLSKSAVWSLFP